jgi:hypothetical protein
MSQSMKLSTWDIYSSSRALNPWLGKGRRPARFTRACVHTVRELVGHSCETFSPLLERIQAKHALMSPSIRCS